MDIVDHGDPVSVAILVLLSFITVILTGYLSMYCYSHYKAKEERLPKQAILSSSSWLESERKPLIPGNFHTQTIQPASSKSDENDDVDSVDGIDIPLREERDYSDLGRIIFVVRYNKKREELMVRLVQIEGMPASQELYCPNSAYVDVGLKYTGDPGGTERDLGQRPPRLDICLQQVYYFIISAKQMLFHSLEFRINTFDEHFRRYVCGMVEVKLSEEMGEDIFNGNEVVFVENILEPFQLSHQMLPEGVSNRIFDNNSSVSNFGEGEYEDVEVEEEMIREDVLMHHELDRLRRPMSCSSSNMSWEPEVSRELLSTSTNSIWNKCISMQDLLHTGELNEDKRAHSVGYLPTFEWTVRDIPLDDDERETDVQPRHVHSHPHRLSLNDHIDPDPTPEQFYHIVPVTPLYNAEKSTSTDTPVHRHVAYRKYPKHKMLARSITMKQSQLRATKRIEERTATLGRSTSCPSLSLSEHSQ